MLGIKLGVSDYLTRVCDEIQRLDCTQIENLSDEWRGMIKAQVRAIKTEQRYSWADIARPLGINRSAAQQRYGDHREAS